MSQYVKSLRESEHATQLFAKEVTVDARVVAEAQVKAAVKSTEALHREAAAYRAIASAAEKGSKEQVAAARLAAQADARLAGALGTASREAQAFRSHAGGIERDLGKATRGALSGSGIFHGFGRSLAFASGGFIAFHEASDFIRESINAAREAIVSQRSLAAQMKTSGESFQANREEIEKVALSYGKFGFQNDEVIASLTVLERGTGNINKAIGLQGLTADLARAKNLELSKAANVVAKVFGGQETALRRAVPGLQKNAHGWDLIRLAQAKLAGQAAANTTAAERFQATLHDTEEIIGTALLPILNKYLTSLGNWLQNMNESGKLQKNVNTAMDAFNTVLQVTKTVLDPVVTLFKALGDAVGGTKHELELLLGVWAGAKFAAKVNELSNAVKALTAARAAAAAGTGAGAAGEGGLLTKGVLGLGVSGALGVGAIAAGGAALLYMQKKAQDAADAVRNIQTQSFKAGSALETSLVPALAKQIAAMKQAGDTGAQILAALRQRLGGSLKADDLIAEAFAFSSGADPKLQARIRAQVAARADQATKTAVDELKKHKGPTIAQRNTWFDNLIERLLGGVADTPTGAPASLDTQMARLRDVAARIAARIDATRDITRKLKLEGQYQQVMNQEWQTQQQINQNTADAAEKAKEARQQAVDNMIAALEVNVAKAGLTKTLDDDIAAQKQLIAKLRQQVRATHGSAEAWQALISAQQQLNTLRKQAADQRKQAADQRRSAVAARQFAQLGFGPTGEDIIPTGRELLSRVGKMKDQIKGTVLDTAENRRLLQRIRETLVGGLGKLAPEVRQKIDELLDALNIEDAAKKRRKKPFFLDPGFGHGVNPFGTGGAIGGGGIVIHNLNLHGVQDVRELENQLLTRAKQRPQPRRG